MSHTPHGVVCGVEFSNLGAHTTLGKYPLHAHMCGNASALAFAANAIHETHHRSLVVHSTSDALFAHNVAYDGTGHMYVLENGLELRNSIVGNVGMVTWPPAPAWSCPGRKCAGDGGCSFGVGADIEACGSRDDDHAEVFWLANPENDVIGNVAVGGYRSGFSIYPVLAGPLVNDWAAQRAAGLDRRQVAWLRVAGADLISKRAVAAAKLFVSDRHGSFQYTRWTRLGGTSDRMASIVSRLRFKLAQAFLAKVTFTAATATRASAAAAAADDASDFPKATPPSFAA